ncbi:ATP-dependent helicase [Desulfitobacterium chlororespirans]|uniref:DNA 3'-5' helicase n=1 Tax=Desulfitobacterium chlororespirans DSM 11544 TaxID=1121395 RepID=A0A1M7RWX7_9FIRM|nr:ATP-dependent helicase [Desulfitobacterium chlororespirans]SHN50676.1 DNA helicase-2 / ATP-dependent DNA helicase PcrA [Desulfitobacterium chlororespirans DSM 11544]
MNEYFKIKLSQISDDEKQIEAYNSTGNTVVIAGPGSGKTTVLTLKVMRLLSEVITPPRGLACLTFSREASREFQERLKLLGLQRRGNVFLGTVHSFCLSEVLTPFAKLYPNYGIPYPIKIISDSKRKRLFQRIKKQIPDELTIEEMDKERTRDISGFSKVSIPSYDVALRVAVAFERELFSRGYIDYISMVKIATMLIQNEAYVQQALEAKFPWLVIDEYQDLGKPLHEMVLSLLQSTNIKIFAVGDADQSIYDFQGASPEYLVELSEWKSVNQCIRLINNYRSAKGIIEASETVLNIKRNYKARGALKDYPANIEFFVCEEGMNEQYQVATSIIEDYIAEGIPFHEIAILAGYNNQLKELGKLCQSKGIPYYLAKQDFIRSDFIKWMENCAAWVSSSRKVLFDDIFEYWDFLLRQHRQSIDYDNRILAKRNLYTILDKSRHYANTLVQWFDFALDSLQIETLLQDSEIYPDEIENLIKLNELLNDESYRDFSLGQFTNLGLPENRVVLSTRHGAKGLEFDIVIMLGMEEGSFPYYKNTSQREIDEAHRLCFVSVSRARKKCILVRSKTLSIPKRDGTWWNKPCEPSRFWNMLYSRHS